MKSSTTPSERSIGFLGFMVMLAKNPFNHVGMTQKVPNMPILVVLDFSVILVQGLQSQKWIKLLFSDDKSTRMD